MPRSIVEGFAPASGVANVDRVAQTEMRNHGSNVRGIVVHVVTVADLAGTSMTPPIMGDHAIPFLHEVEHLGIPVVAA